MTTTGNDFAAVRALVEGEAFLDGEESGTARSLARLCRAARRSLDAAGVAISVMIRDDVPGMVAGSDPWSQAVEDLPFTVGEGPCLDAYAHRRPVLVPDLAAAAARWPGYAAAAGAQGVRAVFAFPLGIGAARLGVLTVFRSAPSPLAGDPLTRAFLFADVATVTLLDGHDAAPGDAGDLTGLRAEVYQAQGMVHAQLGVTLAEAMSLLRAYAFAHDRKLDEVARDVVARKLRLEGDRP